MSLMSHVLQADRSGRANPGIVRWAVADSLPAAGQGDDPRGNGVGVDPGVPAHSSAVILAVRSAR